MGTNTLVARASGEIILEGFFNDFNTALEGDFVGRDSTGVPLAGQNLGTAAFPWGTVRTTALIVNGVAVDTSVVTAPQNRIVSGKTRTTSDQPAFITPNGAANSFVIAAATVNLIFDVNGTAVTASTNVTKSSLTLAPASQNTATVNESAAAAQAATRRWGESDYLPHPYITIASAGTNITALVGKRAAFKIVGTGTEYFTAYVESATKLSKIQRGFFYDSSLAPINRTKFSNGDTITLMKLTWVFLEDNGTTCDVTYNPPTVSYTQPSGPATGDYWYDLTLQTWKRFDGASFVVIDRTLIGQVIQDTANTVGARCQDFYADQRDILKLEVEYFSTTIMKARHVNSYAYIYGTRIDFKETLPTWDLSANLATSADMYSASLQPSTVYYLYLSADGQTLLSDIEPYWREDLCGHYHPHNPWRAIAAEATTSGSIWTNTATTNMRKLDYYPEEDLVVGTAANVATGRAGYTLIADAISNASSGQKILVLPGTYTENLSIDKEVNIIGMGRQTILSGTIAYGTSSDYSALANLKITDNVTLASGATGIFIKGVWLASGKTITDSNLPTIANVVEYIQE